MKRLLALAAALFVSCAAFASGPSEVCGNLVSCGNFTGDVTLTEKQQPGQPMTYTERLIVSKLDVYTILLNDLIVYGDGGRMFGTMTWDFTDDNTLKLSATGKFTIYSDVPNLGGTNKIGSGQCKKTDKIKCSYSYKMPDFKNLVSGSLISYPDSITLNEDQKDKSTSTAVGNLKSDP